MGQQTSREVEETANQWQSENCQVIRKPWLLSEWILGKTNAASMVEKKGLPATLTHGTGFHFARSTSQPRSSVETSCTDDSTEARNET